MVTRAKDILEDPHRLVMGLTAVGDESEWLVIDEHHARDLAEKARLLRDHRAQVFVEESGSRPAQHEILGFLVDHLLTFHASRFRREGSGIRILETGSLHALDGEAPPLETASRLVQEDLVAMERRGPNWCLTAASVCFPTRWDLPSKLGMPMSELHVPVPGYAGPLSDSAERFFDRVKPGLAYQRGNWSLVDDPTLHQPGGTDRNLPEARITAENAGETTWLRREHQTLRALPETGVVLFTIRIFQDSLREVAGEPELARRLLGSVRTMDPALARYKSIPVLRDAVIAYLEERLPASSASSK